MRRRRWFLLSLLLGALAAGPAPLAAQVDVTVVPAMTKGPEGARVTIVEFLDFE